MENGCYETWPSGLRIKKRYGIPLRCNTPQKKIDYMLEKIGECYNRVIDVRSNLFSAELDLGKWLKGLIEETPNHQELLEKNYPELKPEIQRECLEYVNLLSNIGKKKDISINKEEPVESPASC